MLRGFPYSVQRTLISEVTNFLVSNADHAFLSSQSHVLWAMEVIGQGFRLPIEDVEIINLSIEIYRQWLLEPTRVPPPMEQDSQLFWRVLWRPLVQYRTMVLCIFFLSLLFDIFRCCSGLVRQ